MKKSDLQKPGVGGRHSSRRQPVIRLPAATPLQLRRYGLSLPGASSMAGTQVIRNRIEGYPEASDVV